MPNRVLIGSEAQAVLRHLPPQTKRRVRQALRRLKDSWPRPKGIDVAKMRTDPSVRPIYRMRVGTWRIVFRARGPTLEIVRVFPRDDGYDWLATS